MPDVRLSDTFIECDSRPSVSVPDGAAADHIHEFGDVDRIVHVEPSESSAIEEMEPVAPITVKSRRAQNERWHRLGRRMLRDRHLMQYFHSETLFRTVGMRKVSTEELFLDIIIVAAVAALGHELRVSEIGWASIEKFLLLFAAVYRSWRQIVWMWNLWGTCGDFVEKMAIYLTFLALTGIALGAHSAFDDGARPYVAVSSFLATMIPATASLLLAQTERLLKNSANRVNQLTVMGVVELVSTAPYLISSVVGSSSATRALYWLPTLSLVVMNLIPFQIHKYLHRHITNHTRIAVNIELLVEKYDVLTMIFLGETMIGLLFEAGTVITEKGARVGYMYLSAVMATSTLYALQTFYVQIDSPIQKGGKHALRHNVYAGFAWTSLHMPYHFFLVLFATGLNIGFRDVAVRPIVEETSRAILRAGGSGLDGTPSFTTNARWLFSVGWGGSVICSALLGALHVPGPRAATKQARIAIRCIIAAALMIGLPFTNLTAAWFQGVLAIVSVAMSVTEFIFVQMDRIGFFKSEVSVFEGTDAAGHKVDVVDPFGDTSSDSESDDDEHVDRSGKSPFVSNVDLEAGASATHDDDVLGALLKRMDKGHRRRMEPVKPSKKYGDGTNGFR